MNLFSCCVPYFDNCLECIQGPSFSATASYSQLSVPLTPSNRLDVTKSGKDVVILKEGERICGTGGALGTLPIVQNKAYFQEPLESGLVIPMHPSMQCRSQVTFGEFATMAM
ncbi:hypothetical protein OSTOST_21211 [Ostertagia ostertagi]